MTIIINNKEEYSYNNNTILDTKAITLTPSFEKRLKDKFGSSDFYQKYLNFLKVLKVFDETEFNKVEQCGSREIYLICNCEQIFKVWNKCNSKYCLFCSEKKINKYRNMIKEFLKYNTDNLPLRFLTLTWRNTSNIDIELKKKYNKNWIAFKKRLKDYGYNIIKGIKTFEMKYSKNGYNSHLHILLYANYRVNKRSLNIRDNFSKDGFIRVSFLRKIWKEITEDSHILNFQRINHSVKGGVNYLCKYIGKPSHILELNTEQLRAYDLFAAKMRVIEKFGFRDSLKDYKSVFVCPLCNSRTELYFFAEEYGTPEETSLPLIPVLEKNYRGGL